MRTCAFALMFVTLFSGYSNCQAALLVHEPFDYTTGNLNARNPNASTTGLSTITPYAGAGGLVVASGLSFSNLTVSGNGLNSPDGTRVSAVRFAGLPTVTGTIWNSFIANMTSLNSSTGNGMAVRVTNDASTASNRYNVFPDIRTTAGGTNVGASYDDSGDQNSATPTAGSGALTTGTTYLFLTKIDGVGATNLAVGAGSMTTYVLTASQFDNFIASGRSESFLSTSSNVTYTVQDSNNLTNSATNTFANGNFLSVVAVGVNGTVDEIRYGTTLADVTPIPEPSTIRMLLLGTGIAYRTIRRRNAA